MVINDSVASVDWISVTYIGIHVLQKYLLVQGTSGSHVQPTYAYGKL